MGLTPPWALIRSCNLSTSWRWPISRKKRVPFKWRPDMVPRKWIHLKWRRWLKICFNKLWIKEYSELEPVKIPKDWSEVRKIEKTRLRRNQDLFEVKIYSRILCTRPPSGLRDGVIGGIFWRDRVIWHIFWRDGVIKILAWCVIGQNFEAWCVMCVIWSIFRDFRVIKKIW